MSKSNSDLITLNKTRLYSIFIGTVEKPTVRVFRTPDERNEFRERWSTMLDCERYLGFEECKQEGCLGELCLYFDESIDGEAGLMPNVFVGRVCLKHMIFKGPFGMDDRVSILHLIENIEDPKYLRDFNMGGLFTLPVSVPAPFQDEILDIFNRVHGRSPKDGELEKILVWVP